MIWKVDRFNNNEEILIVAKKLVENSNSIVYKQNGEFFVYDKRDMLVIYEILSEVHEKKRFKN